LYPKDHYHIHKCPPPVLILSQLDPVRTLIFHTIRIILSFHLFLGLPCVLLPSGSPKNTLYTLPLSPNHYRTHKCPPTVPILSQLDPVRTLIFHFLTIRILSFHLFLGLPCVLFPSGSPKNILYTSLLSLKRATCPAYLIILVCITRGVFGEECGSEPARDHCERQCLFSQC